MIVQVGEAIGIWWTVFALIAETVVGGWLVRREGRRAWRNLVVQLSAGPGAHPDRDRRGGDPGRRAAAAGPGFLTDFLGFLCVLPLTRPLVRRAVVGYVPPVRRRRRGRPAPALYEPMTRQSRPTDPQVIEGHVVDRYDERDS